MIDMEKKTIYFGYGDILVTNYFNKIIFTEIEPPVEIGTDVSEETKKQTSTGSFIIIEFETLKNLVDFKNLIETINSECCLQFTYDDYTLDFSNYNQKSIDVVITQFTRVMNNSLISMAC
jgi:hypothetical protein